MSEFDYTLAFDPIGEKLKQAQIHLTAHAAQQTYPVRVAVSDGQLSHINNQTISPLLADLIDIAAAVHVSDRLVRHKGDMPRRLLLQLPLRALEWMNRLSIREKLQEVLYWFTEDHWSFEFVPNNEFGRSAETQRRLPWYQDSGCPRKVVLWSGGLDSFAGVYQLLLKDDETYYILFGTGNNNIVFSTQKRTAVAMKQFFPGRTELVQLPFRLEDKDGGIRKSSSARSRGFVFMLLGAVCAYHMGMDTLTICENGIGAINLPFRRSEVGLDHSRSVHPLSLRYMGELVSCIFEQRFRFENPFLFWTKAQMCRELFQSGVAQAVFSTMSCDSPHRKRPMQCGYCSSCLLRRQALAVHSIADHSGYQILEAVDGQQKEDWGTHYYAMLEQVDTMRQLISGDNRWRNLSQRYRCLVDIIEQIEGPPEVTQERILNLYRNYVDEWDKVRDTVGREFLE